MKIKINTPILGLDGQPLLEGFTVKEAMVQSLVTVLPGDEGLTGVQKFQAFTLATKINSADGFVDLSIEDMKLIKDRSGVMLSPVAMGRVWQALEQNEG